CGAGDPANEVSGVGDQITSWFRDNLNAFRQVSDRGINDFRDDLDGRDRFSVAYRITAAYIEQTRIQAYCPHIAENLDGAFDAYTPVLRIAALGTDMKGDAGQICVKPRSFFNDAADIGQMGAEFARQRPVATDIGRIDAQ